jgi:membrane protease YdiL (CAAX protease family)
MMQCTGRVPPDLETEGSNPPSIRRTNSMIKTENCGVFDADRNGEADGLAGDGAAPCLPAACGVYATFGWTALAWTALALTPLTVAIFVQSGSSSTAQRPVLSIIGNLIAIIIVGFAARRAGWPARDYLGLKSRLRAGAAIIGVTGQIALYLMALAIIWWSAGPAGPKIFIINAKSLAEVMFWLQAFALVIVGPISEEIVFRGFMFRGLAQSRMEPVLAILTTSLVFSFLHFDGSWMWRYACGFFYGCPRWRSGATWARDMGADSRSRFQQCRRLSHAHRAIREISGFISHRC